MRGGRYPAWERWAFIALIRKGAQIKRGRTTYRYLMPGDGRRYWWMGGGIIINRARLADVPEQPVPGLEAA